MVTSEGVIQAHRGRNGVYEIMATVPLATREDLSTYYTPGVAYLCLAIKADKEKVYEYTTKANTIAIISDGTRILGLGDIGPEAGLPVMEGKAILFKRFGGVDAIPICINTKDEDEIVKFVTQIAPTFGGINIEDISSPKSFSIAERLSQALDIPIFHDDNYGTAIVVLAALSNAMKLAGKSKDARILINGAGSAGLGVARLLVFSGFSNIIVFDTKGAIYAGREDGMNKYKAELAAVTNREGKRGSLPELAAGADVLIGFSAKGLFSSGMVRSMNSKAIVFALANPEPEITYEEATAAGAFIAATGRSDAPNQVNNMLAFPGVMRGLLDSRARKVTPELLSAAAKAIAGCVGHRLSQQCIMPDFGDSRMAAKVAAAVAEAVAQEAVRLGIARRNLRKNEARDHAKALLRRYARLERKMLPIEFK